MKDHRNIFAIVGFVVGIAGTSCLWFFFGVQGLKSVLIIHPATLIALPFVAAFCTYFVASKFQSGSINGRVGAGISALSLLVFCLVLGVLSGIGLVSSGSSGVSALLAAIPVGLFYSLFAFVSLGWAVVLVGYFLGSRLEHSNKRLWFNP